MINTYPSNNKNGGRRKVFLRIKPYIQPFERVLAYSEIRGLLREETPELLSEIAPDIIELNTVDVGLLSTRLTYWETIEENGIVYIPDQIGYELSDEPRLQESLLSDLRLQILPKRRKLRYGAHDLHEYRGKFFPQLVRSLINSTGLQPGCIVLDPTCGSGTTNVEARALGMNTIGVDLNPLSVLITRVKTSVFDLSVEKLTEIRDLFLNTLNHIDSDNSRPSLRWDEKNFDYLSKWFDINALIELDFLLGKIEEQEQLIVKDFLKVCLSNIIRSVSWQNEEDLRVRKNIVPYERGTAIKLFTQETTNQVNKLIAYISLCTSVNRNTQYHIKEGNALYLTSHFPEYVGKVDLIITSPPYATALPYIDTDRLSLIVLDLLPRSEHHDREYDMIGNREISENQRRELWKTYEQRKSELPDTVTALIDRLAETNHRDGVGFRRRNLPALLSSYFLDMLDVMVQAYKMMKPNGYAFFVVGNNSTVVDGEKVEIPTDGFLWEIGKLAGWTQATFLNMELLPSRDIFRNNRGSSESILGFKAIPKRTSIYGKFISDKYNSTEWDFNDEKTQEHLHALHPYPARFIPQIPRKAILEFSSPGDTVYDPFCGCGTTLLEASLLSRKSIGVDNNPVACLVSRAKVALYAHSDLKALEQFFKDFPSARTLEVQASVVDIPEYKERDYWFDPNALPDLGYIRESIKSLPDLAQELALAALSSIIVRVSFQDSDTRYARKNKTYVQGSALRWFRYKLSQAIDGLQEIIDLPRTEAQVHLADSRKVSFINSDSVDLIITSPPYLNAYDYHKYHRHRIHWINGDVSFARDLEIGKHDTFTKTAAIPDPYFSDMEQCFTEWGRVLKPGGKALIVIGDAIVSGSPVPVSDMFIELLERHSFKLESQWIRTILASRKSFNKNARMQKEHVLLLSHP